MMFGSIAHPGRGCLLLPAKFLPFAASLAKGDKRARR
jgi:hypothetical protein